MNNATEERHALLEDVIVANSKIATDTIDKLHDLISNYGKASVSELYEFIGVTTVYIDTLWGWTSMVGARVERVTHGYEIVLPPLQKIS